jgi:hypothetical protein
LYLKEKWLCIVLAGDIANGRVRDGNEMSSNGCPPMGKNIQLRDLCVCNLASENESAVMREKAAVVRRLIMLTKGRSTAERG